MTKIIGSRIDVGVARETTRGAGVGSSTIHWFPFTSFSVEDKVDRSVSEESHSNIADSYEDFITGRYAEGDLEVEVGSENVGLILYGLLGTLNTVGPTDSSYSHTFTTLQNNQHPTFSILADLVNEEKIYRLSAINEATFKQELDSPLSLSVSWMGKMGAASTVTSNYATQYKFMRKHMSLKIATDVSSLAASSNIRVKSFEITFAKNLIKDNVTSTPDPIDYVNGRLGITGKFTLSYESSAYRDLQNLFCSRTRALRVAWVNDCNHIGAGTTHPSLTFTLPKVSFYDWERSGDLGDLVTQDVNFQAYLDTTTGSNITSAVLVNGTANASY